MSNDPNNRGNSGQTPEDEYDPGYRLPPDQMFKSFLLVAGTYMAFLAAMFFSFFILVKTGYPEVGKLMEDPDNVRAVFEADPESILPRGLFYKMLGVNVVVALLLGWLIARLAKFAKFPHAFFLAVLTFVTFLQFSVTTPADGKWMFLIMMIVLSGAVLFGGKVGSGKRPSGTSA